LKHKKMEKERLKKGTWKIMKDKDNKMAKMTNTQKMETLLKS
jgi:hypothetical protein